MLDETAAERHALIRFAFQWRKWSWCSVIIFEIGLGQANSTENIDAMQSSTDIAGNWAIVRILAIFGSQIKIYFLENCFHILRTGIERHHFMLLFSLLCEANGDCEIHFFLFGGIYMAWCPSPSKYSLHFTSESDLCLMFASTEFVEKAFPVANFKREPISLLCPCLLLIFFIIHER